MQTLIQAVRQYTDKHYANSTHIYFPEVALRMTLDKSVHPLLRIAIAESLDRYSRELQIAHILRPSKIWVERIVRDFEDEWMSLVSRRRRSSVNVDVAEWVVGMKVSEVSDGYVGQTAIPIAFLPKMVFETLAIRFNLVLDGQDVVVGAAVRHDPKAAYRPT